MQVFLIKSNVKYNIFKYIFKRIEVEDDKIILNCNIDKMKLKRKIKIVKEITKILKRYNSSSVILAKKLKQDKEFLNLLHSNQISIIIAKKLFKALIKQILENIISQNKIKKEETEIAVATNNKGEWEQNLIKNLSKEYKSVKIVTNNITYFKKLEEELFEKDGIIVTTTNNKRKALLKANIIINIDFPEELINKYSIYDNSIIINLEEPIKINKKRFCGKIINDYNISLKEESKISKELVQQKYNDFDLKDLVECYVTNKPEELKNVAIQ